MKSKWIKFSALSRQDKIFRAVNLAITAVQFAACIALAVYYITIDDPDNRVFSSFGIAAVTVLPLIGELIFRRRLNNLIYFAIQLYCLLAGFVGSVLNVYYLVSWYDIFIHTLAGYIFSVAGIFIIARLENYSKLSKWTALVFCFCFTMMCELVWELAEWTADLFFNQTAQGLPLPGQDAPLVTDTMIDIFCNFIGGLVFAVQFIIGKCTKCSLGIKFYEKHLATKAFESQPAVENDGAFAISDQSNQTPPKSEDK